MIDQYNMNSTMDDFKIGKSTSLEQLNTNEYQDLSQANDLNFENIKLIGGKKKIDYYKLSK